MIKPIGKNNPIILEEVLSAQKSEKNNIELKLLFLV